MPIPTQPTAALICTEAYKLFGIANPTSSQLTRAADYGIEIVKDDVRDMGFEWDFLRTTGYLVLTVGVNNVQLPTDFAKAIKARILDGSHRGTASAGAASTITLQSTYGGTNPVGQYIVTTGGTGPGQARQITSYVSATRVATVDVAWTTTPDATTTYLLAEVHMPLNDLNQYEAAESVRTPGVAGRPERAWIKADSAEGDLYFEKSPDQIYVIELDYYADIKKVDLTSTLYSRILRLLNGLLIQGVFVWVLQDDSRAQMERQNYERKKAQVASRYLYPENLSNLAVRVDYE